MLKTQIDLVKDNQHSCFGRMPPLPRQYSVLTDPNHQFEARSRWEF